MGDASKGHLLVVSTSGQDYRFAKEAPLNSNPRRIWKDNPTIRKQIVSVHEILGPNETDIRSRTFRNPGIVFFRSIGRYFFTGMLPKGNRGIRMGLGPIHQRQHPIVDAG